MPSNPGRSGLIVDQCLLSLPIRSHRNDLGLLTRVTRCPELPWLASPREFSNRSRPGLRVEVGIPNRLIEDPYDLSWRQVLNRQPMDARQGTAAAGIQPLR